MNRVDVILGLLLAVCALRGYWRGFFRECFGFLALLGGIVAAVQFTALAVAALQGYVRLPAPVQTGVAFMVIFAVVHGGVDLVGVFLDRVASTALLRGLNRFGGALVGAGKGAAVLGLGLLFLHLFPVAAHLDERIMSSVIGRPLVTAAGDALRLAGRLDSPSRT